jgi:hypothetical protein
MGERRAVRLRSDGELIDGHLRLKAAHSLGMREIPVILCDEWTAAQVKAFRLLVILHFRGGKPAKRSAPHVG